MSYIKALSLRQPWAWLVLNGKSIENRRWRTPFRGDFLIHAAKGCTEDEHFDALMFAQNVDAKLAQRMPGWKETERGGIVGIAKLVEVIAPRDSQEALHVGCYPAGLEWRWHFPEQWGFVLENVRPIPFVPCKGALSFFDVPPDVLAQVEAHLGAAA